MGKMRLDDLQVFYRFLGLLAETIGGPRHLRTCSGRMTWPERGIYFFFENGENRADSGTAPRIVRVGTHAVSAGSRTTLWNRLSQHRGHEKSGGGNHRGSVFRKLVGTALIARDGLSSSSWGIGNTAPSQVRLAEQPIEREVSAMIGAMPFLWLDIDDPPGRESKRAYLERNAIALLSNFGKAPLDSPSADWLGRHSGSERVVKSGLWNSQYVDLAYDPHFLGVLDHRIRAMASRN